MILKLEISIIKFLQKYLYTDYYNIICMAAKIITSRTYRNKYLIVYLLFLLITNDLYKIINIPKIYLLGFLSRNINLFIKKIFKRRRPFVIDSTILVNEDILKKKINTFSFPSNSIQTSLLFYKILFNTFSIIDTFTCNILLLLILSITSIAKILKGLHFPTDIIFSVFIFMIIDYLISNLISNIIFFYTIKPY